MLNEDIESYTMMDYPVDTPSNILKKHLDRVISISGKTFCDSNTAILRPYLAKSDTINPFCTGERGEFRVLSEYAYITPRNYSGVTARNSGLFSANRLFSGPSPISGCDIFYPYLYITPKTNNPGWTIARTITKYSPTGVEIENRDATGNYSSAVYGYNEGLPVAVGSNMRQGEMFADGFEDYSLLHVINNWMGTAYSMFRSLFSTDALGTSSVYDLLHLSNSTSPSIVTRYAHTGLHSLSIPGGATDFYAMDIPVNTFNYSATHSAFNFYYPTSYNFSPTNEYLPFQLGQGKKYIVSLWVRPQFFPTNATDYSLPDSAGVRINGVATRFVKKTALIDGWLQVEAEFTVPSTISDAKLMLPTKYYIDDIRCYPADGNMKAFVYNPVNEKLMATLDENNFATIYEYDQEGKLIRVKKETEKGIMTVSESRSNNHSQ